MFQPKAVPGFAITADYYNIKVSNAISTPTSGDAVSACFANLTAASATDAACLAIKRNPVTGGLDGDSATTQGIPLPLTNSGKIATDGIDLSVNFSRDIGFAKFGFSTTGNYTFHSKFQSSPTAINRECVGYYSVNCAADGGFIPGSIQPKWQTTSRLTLGFDTLDVSLLVRHIDKMKQEPLDVTDGNGPANADLGYDHIKAYTYFDLTTRIAVVDNITLTMGVINLANKKPPAVGTGVGTTTYNSGNTYPSTYDALGRRYAMTANVKF